MCRTYESTMAQRNQIQRVRCTGESVLRGTALVGEDNVLTVIQGQFDTLSIQQAADVTCYLQIIRGKCPPGVFTSVPADGKVGRIVETSSKS